MYLRYWHIFFYANRVVIFFAFLTSVSNFYLKAAQDVEGLFI